MDKTRFLENLVSARKKRSLTQKELADALGISDKTYSKWETGENEPDVETLCRLAAYYGVSPAVFFQGEGEKSELEGMGAAEAAQTCWRRILDLLMGLRSCAYPPPGAETELPPPEMPKELRMPGSERNYWLLGYRDLLALTAAGPDLNLTMLMLPHEERYRWLTTAGDGLAALFRFLGLPGATKCLYAILTEKEGSLFTAEYLAGKAGVTEAEAEEVLKAAEHWLIVIGHPYYREETPGSLWSGGLPVPLLGLLSLARILISADPQWGPRGVMASGHAHEHLPPLMEGGTV